MTVIVLTACPAGLRGHLTQWLIEISAGVFVGRVSRRVRDRLWLRVQELAGPGRALLVYQTRNDQGPTFEVHDHHWEPVAFDGVTLMRRPAENTSAGKRPPGWSNASKRRRFGRTKPTTPEAGQEKRDSGGLTGGA